jgi:L-rhamnose mutarotase
MVKSYGMTLLLKDDPDGIAKYKEYHAKSFPEVLKALQKVGVVQLKIFLKGRRLFMYCETVEAFDVKRDFPRHLKMDEKCKEWEEIMVALQEKAPEAEDDEWWASMEEIYDFQKQYRQRVGGGGPRDLGVSLEMYYDSVKRCDVAKPGATDAHGGGIIMALCPVTWSFDNETVARAIALFGVAFAIGMRWR